MDFTVNNEVAVGAFAAMVVIGALLASPLFRSLAFAAAAAGVCFLYAQAGVDGLITFGGAFEADLKAWPDFARGLAIGAALAGIMLATSRLRRVA